MYPEKFTESTPMAFEIDDEVTTIHFQQQAYDSVTEIKYSNTDFPALKIDLYVYSPLTEELEELSKTNVDNPICVTYSVTPTKAATTADALKALHIFEGLFTGRTKVNGQVMVSASAQAKFDPQSVADALSFWETARKLEDKLGIQFAPEAEFPMDDVKFFSELDVCLNQKKQIVWKHPFDHFHLSEYKAKTDEDVEEKLLGTEGLMFKFIEGPINATLLGAEFDIYSFTEISDFVITNIEWDDEEKNSGEVYIMDSPKTTFTLKRLYMTKGEADEFKIRLEKERILNSDTGNAS